MSAHRRISFTNGIPWRYSEARMDLARALGQIAADLWLRGEAVLTGVPFVATVGACHATHDDAEERDREAADRSPRSQTLERRSAR
jgi:hypothetical protein